MIFEDALLNVLPTDFVLLILSALLISLLSIRFNKFKELPDKFLEQGVTPFIIALLFFFSFVAIHTYLSFWNTPSIYCAGWEEGCTQFVLYKTHEISLLIFVSTIILSLMFFLIQNILNSDLWGKLSDAISNVWPDVKKLPGEMRGNLFYISSSIIIIIFLVPAFASFIVGSSYIFLEENFVQPLIGVHIEEHDNNLVDFYFENNSDSDKLITKIKVKCSEEDFFHSWDPQDCNDLPKIVLPHTIDFVTCNQKDYNGCIGCENFVDNIIAYTYFQKEYKTFLKKMIR